MIDRLKIRSVDELIATIPHTLGFIAREQHGVYPVRGRWPHSSCRPTGLPR